MSSFLDTLFADCKPEFKASYIHWSPEMRIIFERTQRLIMEECIGSSSYCREIPDWRFAYKYVYCRLLPKPKKNPRRFDVYLTVYKNHRLEGSGQIKLSEPYCPDPKNPNKLRQTFVLTTINELDDSIRCIKNAYLHMKFDRVDK